MLQQVLSEGAQGSQALIRNTLRPEEHPRVIAKREDDDSNAEQTAPLEVGLISSCLPHRCSAHYGMPGRPLAVRGEIKARQGRGHGKSSSLLSPKGGGSVGLKLGNSSHPPN